MPYRRLPSTDIARINALEAISKIKKRAFRDVALSSEQLNRADTHLAIFNNVRDLYSQAVRMWEENNVKYSEIIKKLTLYISHFVQVYNLATIRGEIREESRMLYYKMEDDSMPDLSTEEKILEWSRRLIEGERQRIIEGGVPMTNPTISTITIYYEKFTDLNFNQGVKENYIKHTKSKLIEERNRVNNLIKEIWNTVEYKFRDLPEEERIEKCKEYGIVYYERPSEKPNSVINTMFDMKMQLSLDMGGDDIRVEDEISIQENNSIEGNATNPIEQEIPFD